MPDLVLLGGGGHARSLLAALRLRATPVRGYLAREESERLGITYLGSDDILDVLDPSEVHFVNALGSTSSTRSRRDVHLRAIARGFTIVGVVHPRAFVDPGVSLAASAQVLANVIINVGARIEEGALINSGAIVEHDSIVGAHAHVAPGAVLAGDVRIGAGAHIGLGARIIQGIEVGSGSVVGAGAVVTSDVPSGVTVAGVPARLIGEREAGKRE